MVVNIEPDQDFSYLNAEGTNQQHISKTAKLQSGREMCLLPHISI